MATQILQTVSKDKRERALYWSHLIYELDQRSAERSAERNGVLQGKLEVARNLKLDGFPFDVISKNTGVPLDKVAAL